MRQKLHVNMKGSYVAVEHGCVTMKTERQKYNSNACSKTVRKKVSVNYTRFLRTTIHLGTDVTTHYFPKKWMKIHIGSIQLPFRSTDTNLNSIIVITYLLTLQRCFVTNITIFLLYICANRYKKNSTACIANYDSSLW